MNQSQLIDEIEKPMMKDIPAFKVGDTISVHYRIIEGEKERSQVFTGTVIARKGKGTSETISIYRVAYGSAMERVIPLHSPKVAKIEVMKRGKVRKGKLFYLRGIFGKKAKIQEKILSVDKAAAVASAVKEEKVEQAPPAEKKAEKPVSEKKKEAKKPDSEKKEEDSPKEE